MLTLRCPVKKKNGKEGKIRNWNFSYWHDYKMINLYQCLKGSETRFISQLTLEIQSDSKCILLNGL